MSENKFLKFLNNTYVSNLIGALILFVLGYIYSYVNAFPKLDSLVTKTDSLIVKIQSLGNTVNNLKSNYLIKDNEGIEVLVGVSSELEQHMVSVYKDNSLNLTYSDPIQLINCLDTYQPSAKLIVGKVFEKGDDASKAEIFISKEAAIKLGFINYQRIGVMKFKLKKIELENKRNGE